MGRMGRYCKAYCVERFREFHAWTERAENARVEKRQVDDKEVEAQRELTDKDHLYLQEDFTVTDGIIIDENVIFEDVTPDWINFCQQTLKFEIPVYESIKLNEPLQANAGSSN